MGLDISFAGCSVSRLWPETFPFLHARTAKTVGNLGFFGEPEGIMEAIDKQWGKLDTGEVTKGAWAGGQAL